MKRYLAVFRLRFVHGLQYRTVVWAGMAAQFFWAFLYIMIYEAFYASSSGPAPMRLEELVAYVWLQQAFLMLVILWYRDNQMFQLITSGNVVYELCRPWDLYTFWYNRLAGQRLAGAVVRGFPLLAAAWLMPPPYQLPPPASSEALLLFSFSLLLGVLVIVAISMFVYISVFITMSPAGSLFLISIIGDFFSGLILPIPLMPGWLQQIAYWLPFRLTADLPFRIYSGHIPVTEAWWGIGTQLCWLLLLTLGGKLALRRALERLVIQGG
ncbi:MAG TPA: ABC transporter permease [Patescibacteria group bacterium]|nr:ABC transporter permease [Patescibacteria group bacterium]